MATYVLKLAQGMTRVDQPLFALEVTDVSAIGIFRREPIEIEHRFLGLSYSQNVLGCDSRRGSEVQYRRARDRHSISR
jgi:hypothetical protein